MTRLATAVAFGILALLAAGHPVHASSCGLAPGDADARAAVRSLVAQQCDCASATDRHVYKRCVSVVVKNAVGSGMLPTHCAADVMRCASNSTCGRTGAVTCCRTTSTGKTKCNIKPTAAKCRPPSTGSACVGFLASCCDACGPGGTCNAPPTTTVTSTTVTGPTIVTTSTSVTTSTTPPAVCGDGVCSGGEQCDGSDFCGATCGNSASGGFLVCRANCTIDASHCSAPPTTSSSTTTSTVHSTTSTVVPTTSSTTSSTRPPAVCGDGVCSGGEQCDGNDFCGATCSNSASGGFLTCRANCTIDASHCSAPPTTSSSTTTSSTVTPTTTTSTTLPNLCVDPLLKLPPLIKLPIQTIAASSTCGGAGLSPAPSFPFSGKLLDGTGHQVSSLGTDCLYIGGGNSTLVPFKLPTGAETVLNVVGLRGFSAIAGPSAGSGPNDCSLGAGPGRHCLNGAAGTDGHGACTSDASCGALAGSCALDANCFFGSPLPITTPVAACAVNVAATDFCGEADLIGFSVDVHAALSTRVYLGACPTCVNRVCQGGARNGKACMAASNGTSTDCLPTATGFAGNIMTAPTLTTGTEQLHDANGVLCAGQASPGAFGKPTARTLQTDGDPVNLLTLETTLAGSFCAPRSGSALIDPTIGLPAPAAATLKGRVDLLSVLRLFGLH